MIDLRIKPYKQDILELLSECIFGDEQKILKELSKYETDIHRYLTGEVINNELVGLIGMENCSNESLALLHIAVKRSHHRKGIGKKMIIGQLKETKTRNIEAETDKDAVDFYRQIGFHIISLGERYPGVERFKCTLHSKQN